MSGESIPRNPRVKRDLFDAKQKGQEIQSDLAQIKKQLTDFHDNVKKTAKAQGHCEDDEATTTSAPVTPVKLTFRKK
ncbi:MAG: hypothetical protein SFW07_04665 [Gammaproteobacteria bacterium]|nr:hypothetical protein [Gammaproteobacteria bacterium]